MEDALATVEAVRPDVEAALREMDLASNNIYETALEEVKVRYPDLCDQSGPHIVATLYILGDDDLGEGVRKVMERERCLGRLEGYLIREMEEKLDQGGEQIDKSLFPHL